MNLWCQKVSETDSEVWAIRFYAAVEKTDKFDGFCHLMAGALTLK